MLVVSFQLVFGISFSSHSVHFWASHLHLKTWVYLCLGPLKFLTWTTPVCIFPQSLSFKKGFHKKKSVAIHIYKHYNCQRVGFQAKLVSYQDVDTPLISVTTNLLALWPTKLYRLPPQQRNTKSQNTCVSNTNSQSTLLYANERLQASLYVCGQLPSVSFGQ